MRHSPARTSSAASTSRRAQARISAKARSAVVSVSTPGVLPTGIPRRRRLGEVDVVGRRPRRFAIARRLGAVVEQLGVDPVGQQAEQPLGVAASRSSSSSRGGGSVALPDVDVVLGGEPVEGVPGQLPGHEAARHRTYHRAPLASRWRSAAGPALSVVIVTHDSAAALPASLPPLLAELRPGDELIVCDNASADGTPGAGPRAGARTRRSSSRARTSGFAAGCNLAAARARNPLLLLLNPDNVVAPGFRDAIELPLTEEPRLGGVAGAGHRRGRRRRSTRSAASSTSPASPGRAARGRPRSAAPAGPARSPSPPAPAWRSGATSGRSSAASATAYFLYHEDTDLGLRLRLAGHRVGIEPRALCDHDYEFAKGSHKWRYLERNRWATMIRTYPARLLAAARCRRSLATELALLLVAASGRLAAGEARAPAARCVRWLPRLLQRAARDPGGRADRRRRAFARACLTPDLDSEYLGAAGRSPLLRALLSRLLARGRPLL